MKIWRVLCFFMSFFVLFIVAGTYSRCLAEPAENVNIMMDGIAVETDVPPYIDDNARTMVPVRFVTEALGFHVGWNQEEQRVRVTRPGKVVDLIINRQMAQVDGEEQELDTAAVLREGRTMVPLRFLAETFGLKVAWQQEERTVAITSPPPPPPPESPGGPRSAIVSGSIVNIRSGPGTDYEPPLTQVARGTNLTVLSEEGAWFYVQLPGGDTGWIASWLVQLPGTVPAGDVDLRGLYGMPEHAARSALVMKPSVNVRSAPGVQHPIISTVSLGQQLPVLDERENWFHVSLPDGSGGWVAKWLTAVRYDGNKQTVAANRSLTAGLISRWSGSGQTLLNDGEDELPRVVGLEVERSGSGVLLKISFTAPHAMPGSFRLDNPSRLVFDFTACLGEDEKEPVLQVDHGAVSRFRLGQFKEQTVRVVADLQGPASFAITQSPDRKTSTIQIRPVDPSDRIIVIDPGHGSYNAYGGTDPGAIGPSGLKERDVVLSISLQLGNILLNEGYTVIYTHEKSTGLSLEERAMVGSISGAELLVSVHANASTNRSLAGTMTFYHAPWGTGLDAQIRERRELAGFIQAELLNRLQREDKGVREANFIILRSCPIPAALVEVAFISNPEEEMLLTEPAFQRKAAEAIALGIKRYLATRQ